MRIACLMIMENPLVVEPRGADSDVILTWEFLEAPNRRFFWRAIASDGAISRESDHTFPTLDECAADASRMWARSG